MFGYFHLIDSLIRTCKIPNFSFFFISLRLLMALNGPQLFPYVCSSTKTDDTDKFGFIAVLKINVFKMLLDSSGKTCYAVGSCVANVDSGRWNGFHCSLPATISTPAVSSTPAVMFRRCRVDHLVTTTSVWYELFQADYCAQHQCHFRRQQRRSGEESYFPVSQLRHHAYTDTIRVVRDADQNIDDRISNVRKINRIMSIAPILPFQKFQ